MILSCHLEDGIRVILLVFKEPLLYLLDPVLQNQWFFDAPNRPLAELVAICYRPLKSAYAESMLLGCRASIFTVFGEGEASRD